MLASPAIALLMTVATFCAGVEAACAKSARARQPAAWRSVSGQPVPRQKPPVARTPTQDEKSWMERASAPSSGGAGGGGM
jgi:hypothetical protein